MLSLQPGLGPAAGLVAEQDLGQVTSVVLFDKIGTVRSALVGCERLGGGIPVSYTGLLCLAWGFMPGLLSVGAHLCPATKDPREKQAQWKRRLPPLFRGWKAQPFGMPHGLPVWRADMEEQGVGQGRA